MKKILIAITIVASAVMANAACVNWKAANLYGSDLTTKLAVGSEVALYGALVTSEGVGEYTKLDTFTLTSAGTVGKVTADIFTADDKYNFYFTFTDGNKQFTSATKENVVIKAVGDTQLAFGNQASATQNASNWAAVPEPTSGLLMLLGMAGLALKRKRA